MRGSRNKLTQKPDQSRISKETAIYTVEGVGAFDDKNDLVVLKIAETGVPLPISNNNDLQHGEPVYIAGYDGTKYKGVQGNIVSGHNSDKQLLIKAMRPTKDIDGHSGSPVLNSKGGVIGVVSAGGEMSSESRTDAPSLVYAIPSTVLKALITNSEQVEPLRMWQKRSQIRAYTNKTIGDMALETGKHKKAIAYYDAALRQNPNMADVYLDRGDVKEDLGDFSGAIEDYDNAIRLNPEDPITYNNRGNVKAELGDFSGAIEDYDNAIRLNPEDADFYYTRGIMKKGLGQQETAEADFTKAKDLDPKIEESRLTQLDQKTDKFV